MADNGKTVTVSDLHSAIINRSHRLHDMLVAGADPNAAVDTDTLLIHVAAKYAYRESVEVLLTHSAHVNAVTKDGNTPLHLTAMTRRPAQMGDCCVIQYRGIQVPYDFDFTRDVIELLLIYGADVTLRNHLGDTPLHCAATNEALRVVPMLLAAGTDPNIRNNSGDTPLDIVRRKRGSKPADFLLAHLGYPLHLAAIGGGTGAFITKLLREGNDPNRVTECGCSPLQYAIVWGHNINLLIALVESGADISLADSYGDTPLHEAAAYGHSAEVDYLLGLGADPYARNSAGQTPYDRAVEATRNETTNKDDVAEKKRMFRETLAFLKSAKRRR